MSNVKKSKGQQLQDTSSILNMLGWSFVMIRNGLTFVLLKPRETLKKRKCEDGAAQSSSSHAEAHEGSNRPPGVKAAKATGWTINIRRASCSGSDDGVRVAKVEKEINH
ncbi:uncharacterized protein LOC106427007 isoform X3 [Brassica napus]|uniref:uncharacterized protein LOC106427007 isoform X3 n=1 Tax=Brassica napus TaxID=3708 RepID=UPI002079C8D8|nr:uncharacterized protein LOC106427007 isoform X3 [Brassica napus]